jgi:hypothetical protein
MAVIASRTVWIRDMLVPLAVVLVPLGLAMALNSGAWLFAITPIAFAYGLLARPKRVWPIWIASLLVLWIGNALIATFDLVAEVEGAGEETVAGFMMESLLGMAGLVLLPAWLGRVVGRLVAHGAPREPVT